MPWALLRSTFCRSLATRSTAGFWPIRRASPVPICALSSAAPSMLNERVRDNAALVLNDQVKCGVPACDILHNAARLWVVLPCESERFGELNLRTHAVPAILLVRSTCLAGSSDGATSSGPRKATVFSGGL